VSTTVAMDVETRPEGGALWRRQVLSVARHELGGRFSAWRSLWLLLLAFAPPFIILMHAIYDRGCVIREETLILAGMVQVFYMRFGIFFGCLGIVMRLVRGEMVERSLHYFFLAPLRREVLLLGKFLAGTLTAIVVFGAGVTASLLLMYGHSDAGREFLASGPALAHLRAYLLVTVLACLGYGAVLLALSLVFRNPILPAVVVLLWEGLNGILPVWLKRFSVTSYLKPLMPVELPVEGFSGLFTVVAEPTPAWVAVTGLLAFVVLTIAFACWRIRRLEISYSTD
jgi:ABC-type transport system involved in multi-copper enzyme maturation permease subunit